MCMEFVCREKDLSVYMQEGRTIRIPIYRPIIEACRQVGIYTNTG